MLTQEQINGCMERGIRNIAEIFGLEEVEKVVKLVNESDPLTGLIHSVAAEVSFLSVNEGIAIAEKEKSVLTMPENTPVLVRDKEKGILTIVVPREGKYLMVGTGTPVDIKPTCWYDVDLLKPVPEEKQEENGKAHIQNV